MVSGNDKVAKPRINNAIGALSDPRIETLTRVSINVVKDDQQSFNVKTHP